MKVKELKQLLENYTDDAPVLIYDDGIIKDLSTRDTIEYNQSGSESTEFFVVTEEWE